MSPRRATLALAACALLAQPARAHDGPPYPIFVDESVAGWTLSIWTDPDVGTGTFYYYVEPPAGRTPADVSIEAVSVPQDGLAPEVRGLSEAAESGEPFQQIGTLEFAHRGIWDTRFLVHEGAGDGPLLGELLWPLDVTPPGLGAFDLLWFALPFLALGLLWLKALMAQLAHDRAPHHTTENLS